MVQLFNLCTLEREEFPRPGSDEIPQYATLSQHVCATCCASRSDGWSLYRFEQCLTWWRCVWNGAEVEISHAEWSHFLRFRHVEASVNQDAAQRCLEIQSKPGFSKIKSFVKYVQQNHEQIQYGWAHTICVDPAQESASILSHWTVFKRSEICVAFLDDVPPGLAPLMGHPPRFCNSKWFRRCWTLQELVAPKNMIFVDSTWAVLSSRRILGGIISDITQIKEKILLDGAQNDEFFRIPASQRLAWAANRQTSRPEDRAYSLIGLLNVTGMAPNYGEGGARAFRRLLDHVLVQHGDTTVLAWGFHFAGPWSLHGLLPDSPLPYACCRELDRIQAKPCLSTRSDPFGRGRRLDAWITRPPDINGVRADFVCMVLDAEHPEDPEDSQNHHKHRLVLPLIPVRRDDPTCDEYWRAPSCVPVAFCKKIYAERRSIVIRDGPVPVADLLGLQITGLESAAYNGVLQEVWPPTIYARDGRMYLPGDAQTNSDRREEYILLRFWAYGEEVVCMIHYKGRLVKDETAHPSNGQSANWPHPGPNQGGRRFQAESVGVRRIGFSQLQPNDYKTAYASLADYFREHTPDMRCLERLFALNPAPELHLPVHIGLTVPIPGTGPHVLAVRYLARQTAPMDRIHTHFQ